MTIVDDDDDDESVGCGGWTGTSGSVAERHSSASLRATHPSQLVRTEHTIDSVRDQTSKMTAAVETARDVSRRCYWRSSHARPTPVADAMVPAAWREARRIGTAAIISAPSKSSWPGHRAVVPDRSATWRACDLRLQLTVVPLRRRCRPLSSDGELDKQTIIASNVSSRSCVSLRYRLSFF